MAFGEGASGLRLSLVANQISKGFPMVFWRGKLEKTCTEAGSGRSSCQMRGGTAGRERRWRYLNSRGGERRRRGGASDDA